MTVLERGNLAKAITLSLITRPLPSLLRDDSSQKLASPSSSLWGILYLVLTLIASTQVC